MTFANQFVIALQKNVRLPIEVNFTEFKMKDYE